MLRGFRHLFWLTSFSAFVIAVQAQDLSDLTLNSPGARLAFPGQGNINAFVIFIQHKDEPDQAGDYGSDPVTEWPYDWSRGSDRKIPAWATDNGLISPPGTHPESFAEGSLSSFYDVMSRGKFALTGYVYPRVYFPGHPVSWYHANRDSFQNGAVKLAHEILMSREIQEYFEQNPDDIDLSLLDRYRNGTEKYAEGGDGIIDLIIIIDRGTTLPRLRLSDKGQTLGGSSITSFGVDGEFRQDFVDYTQTTSDGFLSSPVLLGGMKVIDNLTSGSGITVSALTRKQAVRIISHEIGHRQFGLYHTCNDEHIANSDCIGIMGGAYLTMSAGDRIKLGWAEVEEVDILNHDSIDVSLPDAISSGKVIRLREGENSCGDLIVEARFWSNYWDAPPNATNPDAPFFLSDDGDQGDIFLPQEGLYIYKAPEPANPRCGGNRKKEYDYSYYSSMENSGENTRLIPFRKGRSEDLKAFRIGGTYRTAYAPGDVYAPYLLPDYYYHINSTLDAKLSITDIKKAGDEFTFRVWTDYYMGPGSHESPLITNFPNPFSEYTVIEYLLPEEGQATVTVYDTLGRKVVRTTEGLHQAGLHRVYLDASSLSTGTYIVVVETAERRMVHTMQMTE